MPLIKITNYDKVEGARFGKFNLADNSTSVLYRLGRTIIDTGPPNQTKAVLKYLSDKNFQKVILTHHHEDHSGNGAAISKFFGTPVYIYKSGIKPVQEGFPIKLYQKVFWGKPNTFTPKALPTTIKTGEGHTLEAIHTPGHAPDHVCFLEPDRKWLFTGDLFLATKPKLFRADENLEDQINSLKKVLEYDFETVFCAHRGIVENGYSLIREKLGYFTELIGKVKNYHLSGCSTNEITAKLFGKKDSIGMISFKHICFENLVKECIRVKLD